jgi:hypothetical protein
MGRTFDIPAILARAREGSLSENQLQRHASECRDLGKRAEAEELEKILTKLYRRNAAPDGVSSQVAGEFWSLMEEHERLMRLQQPGFIHGYTRRDARTIGIRATMEKQILKQGESSDFAAMHQRGGDEVDRYSIEAIVDRHPHEFSENVVRKARIRLKLRRTMRIGEAWAHFGARPRNQRWAWCARGPNGIKVFTAWNHRGELKADLTTGLEIYEPLYEKAASKPGGSDLRDALREAADNQERARLIEIEPVDPHEDPLRIWAAIPRAGWWRVSFLTITADGSFNFRLEQVTQSD